MKIKNIFTGLFTLLVISIVGIGASFAHGGEISDNSNINNAYNGMGYGMGSGMMMGPMMFGNQTAMYEDMNNLLDNGSYNDLIKLREEYNMPIMYWVENQEDLELMQETHERFGMGFTMMPKDMMMGPQMMNMMNSMMSMMNQGGMMGGPMMGNSPMAGVIANQNTTK